jgi:MFS transporter, DHA1 family, tetracycline resistance protein
MMPCIMIKDKKRSFFILFLIVATELIGFGLIIPILPQIASRFENTPLKIGLLLAAYSAAQFIAAPLLGALSDKFGRKPILLISKLGTVLSYILLAFSGSYWLIFISRLMDGFTGGNISAAKAYAADITTPEDRPKGMAVIGMAFGTGFILGPALGGLLYGIGNHGHTVAAIVAGSLSLLAFFLTLFLLEEPEKRHEKTHYSFKDTLKLFKHRGIATICLIQVGFMILFSSFESTFSLFTAQGFGFNERQNSFLFLYVGILALFIQGGLTRRAPKNLIRTTGIGLLAAGLGFLAMHVSGTLSLLLIALAILSLGVGFVNSYLPSLLTVVSPEGNRGAVIGIYEGIGSLSRIIGPFFGYWAVTSPLNHGYGYFAVILGFLAILLFFGFRRQTP